MKSNTEKILRLMKVLAWITCMGLVVVAGSITISYFVSIGNPDGAKNLYNGFNLYAYRQLSFGHYTFLIVYKIATYGAQAYIAYLITSLLRKINLSRPFSLDVAKTMQKISYVILGLWTIVILYNIHILILEKIYGLKGEYITSDALVVSGVAYVLAQMFKRGAEIQSENDLTV